MGIEEGVGNLIIVGKMKMGFFFFSRVHVPDPPLNPPSRLGFLGIFPPFA